MTTKPKARKFRIRRTSLLGSAAVADDHATEEEELDRQEEPAVARAVPGPDAGAPVDEEAAPPEAAHDGQVGSAAEAAADTDIEAIRREGLTGRQLRMARRVAQKHNLPATSDFDAVRLLREQGIDPFARANMLELVVPQSGTELADGAPDAFAAVSAAAAAGQMQAAQQGAARQPIPHTTYSPAPELTPAQRRERDIGAIQRDIMLRRRKRLMLLLTRLAFFVLLPTVICGWFFYKVATPMYSSKSEFLILQADNVGGSGLGGLLSGTQFATSQDSIATQSYLQSKDAMLRLDSDVGFKSHFSQDWIDPIQRLAPDASNEEAYRTYSRNVKIGYDPTEGVIRMEVAAADPEVAREFSDKLISYAEQRINHLSEQKRADQMRDAKTGFAEAEEARRQAQAALVNLQQQGALLDPEALISTLRGQINNVELQLQDKELQLAALLDNARPNQARVDGAQADVDRLRKLLDGLNAKMIDASKGENSLAELSARIEMARADLTTRNLMLESALQQVEQTRMEANRQVRYLTTSVQPVASQEASYPRKFENTILAFLIFSGIYLMLSLTASILREQVTS
ncbi:capsule biosynthesis protein [Seohaeicola zhoushanensis]|uniref:Capsule polysaccharide transporter n=1 Tax=Seohaeicola zhoushanensis TaxID=1569283 RepID=A0A8J3GXE7_9RHOB|nr:capsule biosynthesis protein [Seohaeicola zhoushanensis]GHF48636.1 capsule polysaccharide transporter [Seohaeicola zhoushanensis]